MSELPPIAYVAAKFPLPSETFVYREVREMRRRGWKITTATLHDHSSVQPGFEDLYESRIVVYSLGMLAGTFAENLSHPIQSLKTLLLSIRDVFSPGEPTKLSVRIKLPIQALAALSLAHKLRPEKIQWIHCHFAHAPATVGMYAARQLSVPFSFTGHANDLFHRRALLSRKLQRAALVVCISRWHQKEYESIAPGISSKCELVRCGVDTSNWQPSENHPPSDRLRILTVCRLVEKKGADTLIESFAQLDQNKIPATLTIAGTGPCESRLRDLAKKSPPINWLGDVDNSKIPALLAQSDVFALPCRTDSSGDKDGIPVVLMEAMACGVPVVSGDLPSIRELIDNQKTGILIPGGDATALTEALTKLAADPSIRHNLAQAGRQKVASEFSLAANVDRLESRIKNMLSNQ
jgi:colanic acid/amylovoran biosynthesis glycosyltransferase